MEFLHQIATDLADHFSVIVGTFLGFVGGTFATVYAQNRQSKREKYKELQGKVFMLACEFQKIETWASTEKMFYYHSDSHDIPKWRKHMSVSPTEKIRVLAFLYFPQIHDKVLDLVIATSQYQRSLIAYSTACQAKKPEDAKKHAAVINESAIKMTKIRLELEVAVHELLKDFLDEKTSSEKKIQHILKTLRASDKR